MSRKLNRKGGKRHFQLSSSYDDSYLNDDSDQFQMDDMMKSLPLLPKNPKQEEYVKLLQNSTCKLIFATGPAGTGKTMLACIAALNGLVQGTYDRILITRPAVNVEENLGFLPGDISDKMDPYLKPIFDVFGEYYSQSTLQQMQKDKILEICPLAYMRGRTFKNAFIIADELQNATVAQMKMILTRIGSGTKMIITGDPGQHDRKYCDNGLIDILKRLKSKMHSNIKVVEFGTGDIERSQIVKDVLDIYGDSDQTTSSSASSTSAASSSTSSDDISSISNSSPSNESSSL